MTDMPQMVAIYNGMGGGAAAAIAAIEFARGDAQHRDDHPGRTRCADRRGVLTGSCVAWAKLQGVLKKAIRLPAQNAVNVCWRSTPSASARPWWSWPRRNRN
jgi:NAD(P) transhydrogenase subunit beta